MKDIYFIWGFMHDQGVMITVTLVRPIHAFRGGVGVRKGGGSDPPPGAVCPCPDPVLFYYIGSDPPSLQLR
jgi:hypothetical protein